MKRWLIGFVSCAALAACDKYDAEMTCGNYDVEIKMSKNGEVLDARISGAPATMKLGVSASGARYLGRANDVDVALWNKGSEWTLYVDDGTAIPCNVK